MTLERRHGMARRQGPRAEPFLRVQHAGAASRSFVSLAVRAEMGEDAGIGVRIEAQPGYGWVVRGGWNGRLAVRLVLHDEPYGLFV
jgi:hypothetical protein